MTNLISLHHDTRIVNDAVLWRNVKCLNDEELFDEYQMVREEMRRRKNTNSVH